MAVITSSVAPQFRGGFLGANSAEQHVAAALGVFVGRFILTKTPGGTIEHYPLVELVGMAATLVSVWLAGRIHIVDADRVTGTPEPLAASALGPLDADHGRGNLIELLRWLIRRGRCRRGSNTLSGSIFASPGCSNIHRG